MTDSSSRTEVAPGHILLPTPVQRTYISNLRCLMLSYQFDPVEIEEMRVDVWLFF